MKATECPVSLVTQQSWRWIATWSRSRSLRVKPLPGSLISWPARLAEVFGMLAEQENRLKGYELQKTKQEAEMRAHRPK